MGKSIKDRGEIVKGDEIETEQRDRETETEGGGGENSYVIRGRVGGG